MTPPRSSDLSGRRLDRRVADTWSLDRLLGRRRGALPLSDRYDLRSPPCVFTLRIVPTSADASSGATFRDFGCIVFERFMPSSSDTLLRRRGCPPAPPMAGDRPSSDMDCRRRGGSPCLPMSMSAAVSKVASSMKAVSLMWLMNSFRFVLSANSRARFFAARFQKATPITRFCSSCCNRNAGNSIAGCFCVKRANMPLSICAAVFTSRLLACPIWATFSMIFFA
mmetsp:Transcript_19665/g.69619  ORF Transcript_19665/g.69619 Transcript_19665/m.69619 type:complete len:224 (-) Transcript_19665:910-1581(-)